MRKGLPYKFIKFITCKNKKSHEAASLTKFDLQTNSLSGRSQCTISEPLAQNHFIGMEGGEGII